jgi:hypothetical protein
MEPFTQPKWFSQYLNTSRAIAHFSELGSVNFLAETFGTPSVVLIPCDISAAAAPPSLLTVTQLEAMLVGACIPPGTPEEPPASPAASVALGAKSEDAAPDAFFPEKLRRDAAGPDDEPRIAAVHPPPAPRPAPPAQGAPPPGQPKLRKLSDKLHVMASQKQPPASLPESYARALLAMQLDAARTSQTAIRAPWYREHKKAGGVVPPANAGGSRALARKLPKRETPPKVLVVLVSLRRPPAAPCPSQRVTHRPAAAPWPLCSAARPPRPRPPWGRTMRPRASPEGSLDVPACRPPQLAPATAGRAAPPASQAKIPSTPLVSPIIYTLVLYNILQF